jgi:hypothetical protein
LPLPPWLRRPWLGAPGLHFFLKRAHANAHAIGDSRWHRDRVADLARI